MRVPLQIHRFVDVSAALLAQGYCVRFRAAGRSMRPSIGDGDILTIAPIAASRLSPGAIAVYRAGNRIFAHRLVAIAHDERGRLVLTFRGDATSACDAPVGPDQVLGEVIDVERGSFLPPLVARARGAAAAPLARLGDLARGACLAITRRASFP